MLKFFFNLYFQYDIESDQYDVHSSTFNLGYFSSYKNAQNAISFYKDKPGFNEFELNCFKIQRFGVKFAKCINNKKIDLYELSHEYLDKDSLSEWTLFGVYSSLELALIEQGKQSKKRKYRTSIEGFHIEKWKVDEDFSWKEGFERSFG